MSSGPYGRPEVMMGGTFFGIAGRSASLRRTSALTAMLAGVLAASGCDCGTSPPMVDAALPDSPAVPDAAIECEDDRDCDDGVFCNGAERCGASGRCETEPVDCDDDVACTLDACSEDRRTCTHEVPDLDEDGYADAACLDARGMPLGNDCDDGDANRFPGNLEVCDDDAHDEDCDLATRGGVDADGDGFEDIRCCNPMRPGDTAPNCGPDCDDGRRSTNPGGTEVCNALNDDCDAMTDEGVSVPVYRDADRDGYGTGPAIQACSDSVGFATLPGDCDDTRIDRSPGQPEFCDMVDNDCNEVVDDMTREVTWYRDADGDGFGIDGAENRSSCEPLTAMGYSLLGSDCDDTTRSISPVAAEMCNGRDDDCNGRVDFRIGADDFEDDDADGVVDLACGAPFGEDCDDRNPATGPGETEICDGRDNDCDMDVDEGATSAVFYRDADMDGYGSITGGTVIGCSVMPGYVAMGGDCDDADPMQRPGASETCNGEDDDCDGAADDAVSLPPLPNAEVACVGGAPAIVRCTPGYENCNAMAPDGCEVQLTSDLANCGFCGNACPTFAGTAMACAGGTCRVASCPADRRDCNASGADGCERPVGTVTDCGDCNDRCALPHVARQACVGGACTFDPATDCEPGWADCDGTVSNGCERPLATSTDCAGCGDACDATEFCDVSMRACRPSMSGCTAPQADCDGNGSCETNTATSTASCGACGRACSGGNATWACNAGACQVASCTGGFRDCDGLAANGCEASATSVSACGPSCIRCDLPNATPVCSGGACAIGACAAGWADCNGIAADGCEANVLVDATRCGSCFVSCNDEPGVATGACSAGSCRPVTCDPGFADCSPGGGCETSVLADASNCGACGRACGTGGACEMGVCDSLVQVAMGQYHTCALRSSGTVVCWGRNDEGQLGTGGPSSSLPVVVPGLSDVVQIATGWAHTCAVLSNGRVRCWGANDVGQVGSGGTSTSEPSPVPVLRADMTELDRVTRLSTGPSTTCALRTSGRAECWGANTADMIVQNGMASYATAQTFDVDGGKGLTRIVQLALGATYVAFRASGWISATGDYPGTITGWGGWIYDLWGDASDVADLASGRDHVCIRRISGAVECIGDNSNGQLADGTTITPMFEVGTLFTSSTGLMLFDDTTCSRNTLGQVFCMGLNDEAQCTGPGSPTPVTSPRRVNVAAGGPAFSSSSLGAGGGGAFHTPCIVSTAGGLFCWGNNLGGQIGDGTTIGREYPTRTLGLTP
jgi:alpha-tubulin suppressor-like RCC1 family protein